MNDWKTLLEQLAQPFDANDIQWRAGATTRDKKKAQALPYAEPRVYEDRLNEVCPGDWSVVFKPWGENKLICELTLHAVTRSSTGEFDSSDKISQGTTAEAQSFKRACSKFGLGRYLYDIDAPWVEYDNEKSKLLETPRLPAKFLPAQNVAKDLTPKGQALPTQNPSPEPSLPVNQATGLLSEERARAMEAELEKLGYGKREAMRIASSVLEKPVRDFARLTEAEALEVWSYVKRVSREQGRRAA